VNNKCSWQGLDLVTFGKLWEQVNVYADENKFSTYLASDFIKLRLNHLARTTPGSCEFQKRRNIACWLKRLIKLLLVFWKVHAMLF